jgi:aerobic-type carbon monoxide dehydrogenase small subunit (CoxS/CutS family)
MILKYEEGARVLISHAGIKSEATMSTPIRFYYRGAVHEVQRRAPTQTVLQHLREDLHCTGTKEGCAEGDCGACTVVIGSLENGQLEMKAVNSCIQFTPTLDGKALFTVEDLQQAGGALHPVQQALVECHGSQCGFCTPGFAMSLWGMYLKQDGQRAAPRDRRLPVRQPVPLHRLPSHHRRRPRMTRAAARRLRPRKRVATARPAARSGSRCTAPTARPSRAAHLDELVQRAPPIRRPHCWPAPPTSACGSPSRCAT